MKIEATPEEIAALAAAVQEQNVATESDSPVGEAVELCPGVVITMERESPKRRWWLPLYFAIPAILLSLFSMYMLATR